MPAFWVLSCSSPTDEQGIPSKPVKVRSIGEAAPIHIRGAYANDLPMWNHIISSRPAMDFPAVPKGAIIPHHVLVARELSRFYSGLAKKIHPKTIFVLCPNHFETTKDDVVTARNCSWDTVYGELELDGTLTAQLAQEGLATISDASFEKEHGIFVHAPFIKYYFPNARIVPILLRWKNDRAENIKLARWIAKRLDGDSFVLASVDFSHYQPRAIADFHDQASYLSITGFMPDAVYDREIDSPSSVYTLMKIMDAKGNRAVKRLLHTNSDDILGICEARTTSHQFFVFSAGDSEHVQGFTVLVGGMQAAGNRGKSAMTGTWVWDRYQVPDAVNVDYLKQLRGEEDRLLVGSDLCLFALPEKENVFSYRFPGGKLRVFRMTTRTIDAITWSGKIQKAKAGGFRVIVLFETDKDDYAARKARMLELSVAGADAVIRRGPGAMGFERYDDRLIIYGLGELSRKNFNGPGLLAGLAFLPDGVSVTVIPITVVQGFPMLSEKFDPSPL